MKRKKSLQILKENLKKKTKKRRIEALTVSTGCGWLAPNINEDIRRPMPESMLCGMANARLTMDACGRRKKRRVSWEKIIWTEYLMQMRSQNINSRRLSGHKPSWTLEKTLYWRVTAGLITHIQGDNRHTVILSIQLSFTNTSLLSHIWPITHAAFSWASHAGHNTLLRCGQTDTIRWWVFFWLW